MRRMILVLMMVMMCGFVFAEGDFDGDVVESVDTTNAFSDRDWETFVFLHKIHG